MSVRLCVTFDSQADLDALKRLASAMGVSAAGWVRIAVRDATRGRPGTRKVYPESVADWVARDREAKESVADWVAREWEGKENDE